VNFSLCDFIESAKCGISSSNGGFTRCESCTFRSNCDGLSLTDESTGEFFACMFAANSVSGVSLRHSRATFIHSGFIGNFEVGASISDAAVITFLECAFTQNQFYGAHILSVDTRVNFEDCEFSYQQRTGAILVNAGANLRLLRTGFFDDSGPSLEVRGGSRADVTECEFFRSGVGIAVLVHDDSEAVVTKSLIQNQSQSGIVAGRNGTVDVRECQILDCRVNGMYFLKGSAGTVQQSTIQRNGECGIDIVDASPRLLGNRVEGHRKAGVNVREGQPVMEDNVLADNGPLSKRRSAS
jgi:hypothetical protein